MSSGQMQFVQWLCVKQTQTNQARMQELARHELLVPFLKSCFRGDRKHKAPWSTWRPYKHLAIGATEMWWFSTTGLGRSFQRDKYVNKIIYPAENTTFTATKTSRQFTSCMIANEIFGKNNQMFTFNHSWRLGTAALYPYTGALSTKTEEY